MDNTPALALRGVHKHFGRVRAVDGLDLTVKPGEIVAFLGQNGAGKTTTVDMITGLSLPSTGSLEVFGMTPRAAVDRGLVAAVMQSGGLLKDITVRETVELTASLFAHNVGVDEVLHRAGITDLAHRKVGKCSGGQQQRLRFAMALVSDPALLILDEPTTGMDVTGRRDFWRAIRDDAARGRTVLFATHYLEEADLYADRIVLMAGGRIVADGTAAEVKASVSGRTVRAVATAYDLDALRAIPGVEQVDERAGTLTVHACDSDAVARYLLQHTDARDLEITSKGLDDAFIALTDSSDVLEGVLA